MSAMTISSKPSSAEDGGVSGSINNHAALLSQLISDLIGDHWGNSFSGFSPHSSAEIDRSVDVSYRRDEPVEEPHRSEYLYERVESVFRELLPTPTGKVRHGKFIVGKEVIEMMVCLLRFRPSSPLGMSGIQIQMTHRIQRLAVGFLRSLLTLSRHTFVRFLGEIVPSLIRILRGREESRNISLSEESLALIAESYGFMSFCLASPLTSNIFSATDVRDLSTLICMDIRQPRLQNPVSLCLASLLQTNMSSVRTENRDKLFSVVIAGIKFYISAAKEGSLPEPMAHILRNYLSALSAFISNATLHMGVLNICSTVFREVISLNDPMISLPARQGLQLIDCLLRPRAPKEVLESPRDREEPFAGNELVAPESFLMIPNREPVTRPKGGKPVQQAVVNGSVESPVTVSVGSASKRPMEDEGRDVTNKRPKSLDGSLGSFSEIPQVTDETNTVKTDFGHPAKSVEAVNQPAEVVDTKEPSASQEIAIPDTHLPEISEDESVSTGHDIVLRDADPLEKRGDITEPKLTSAAFSLTETTVEASSSSVDDGVAHLLSLFQNTEPDEEDES